MSECKCEHWQVCDKCMPERWKPKVARPHEQLINELLNPNTPKTEREHAAAREIEIFRNGLTIPEMRTGIALQLREIESLRAALAASEARAERLAKSLKEIIDDLETRSDWKEGTQKGVVDIGHVVYLRGKAALAERGSALGRRRQTED